MLKKFIMLILLLTALFPLNALAQQNQYSTVQEIREQVVERWTQSYETKWRTIEIDVQPTAPSVDSFPILKVSADYWLPDITPLGQGWTSAIREDNGLVNIKLVPNEASSDKNLAKKDTTFINPEFFPPFDLKKVYPENSTLSLEDVFQHLENLLTSIGEDPNNWDHQYLYKILTATEVDSKGAYVSQGEYMMQFHQKLSGIPLFNRNTSNANETSRRNDLFFNISGPDEIGLAWYKVKPIETLVSDIPLCDFSVVKSNIEKAIEAGHIRRIFSLDLGYALFNEPGVPRDRSNQRGTVYYAYPVWKLDGYYVGSGKKELGDYSKLGVPERSVKEFYSLMFDAQTGEMIDSINSPKGSGDFKGFVSWDDVGSR